MAAHRLVQAPGRYVKLAAALFGAIASAVVAMGLTGGKITTAEWLNIAIAGIGAIHVWYVTETSDNPNGKAVLAALTAGLITLQSFVTTSMHVNLTMWMQVGLAALTATGIWAAPSTLKRPATLDPPTPANKDAVRLTPGTVEANITVDTAPLQTQLNGVKVMLSDQPAPPRQDLP